VIAEESPAVHNGGYVRAPCHSAESRPAIRPGPAGASAGPIVGKASLPETAPNAHDRINGVEYLSRFGHYVDVAQEADEAGLTESRGKWILPVGDGIVTQIRIDFAFTLVLESWIEIRIETAFSYGPPGAGRQFEPSDPTALAPLLGLHQAVVAAAQIRKDGRLTMTFADDAVLEVGPDERYEAFQVTGSLPPIAAASGLSLCPEAPWLASNHLRAAGAVAPLFETPTQDPGRISLLAARADTPETAVLGAYAG
jgi:hypothetical protein